jgi:hypothetical protein
VPFPVPEGAPRGHVSGMRLGAPRGYAEGRVLSGDAAFGARSRSRYGRDGRRGVGAGGGRCGVRRADPVAQLPVLMTTVEQILSANVCFLSSHSGHR